MESSTGFKEYHFIESGGSREFRIRGWKVKQDEFMVGSYHPNAAFEADPLDHPFISQGLNHTEQSLLDWAADNGFDLVEQGEDQQAPYIVSIAVNAGKTVVTITFNEDIDKTDDAAALKAAITIATDGETYSALGGSDSVGTVDGTSTDLVITFNSALTTSTNLIKIAKGAIKDADGNENDEIITDTIDVAAPVPTFDPADSATDVPIDQVITLTFDEKIFNAADGSEIENSDIASIVELKETNDAGSAVAFTGTINAAKTIITITPDADLTNSQVYYVELIGTTVEDVSGNETAETSVTFTTVAP